MALTTNIQTGSFGVVNQIVGQVVTDAGAAADTSINIPWIPRYLRWFDRTNRISLEWFEGMAANTAIRTVAAGTRTLDVASGITISTDADSTVNRTFKVKAADIPASSAFSWEAMC